MIEIANRKAWVMASDEILEELRGGWSRPVEAHADENPDGSWNLTFRIRGIKDEPLGEFTDQHKRIMASLAETRAILAKSAAILAPLNAKAEELRRSLELKEGD